MKFKVFQDASFTDTPFQFYFTEVNPDNGWYKCLDDDLTLHIKDFEYTTP